MRSFLFKIFILIISLNFSISSDWIQKTGDIFQIAIPLSGVYMTYQNDDKIGREKFLKSYVTTLTTTYLLKKITARERPDGSNTMSFPSGHTSSAFSGASFINSRYGLKFGIPAYCAASFVGYSRVHAKKHYWTDVIAGAVLATLTNYLFTKDLDVKVNAHIDPVNHNIHVTVY
ncbi:MAG: phosphatase PAP2 family protein [Candidatus Marinimicrobia bacterium]|nr:phosphatase PAP2 family protein [Candidatus Neomarinimicrobiota bacterium]